jgi:DNA end-binding protein Ku
MARKKLEEPKARASWSGMLRFGLVAFPVQAFNAFVREGGAIAFHQLHAECHSRIRYQKVCPLHGPVDKDEIVSGYEFGKDRYVEIDPEELDELRTDRERALTIDNFVSPDEFDDIYLDGRIYYLAPDGAEAREPYVVFLEALRRQDRYGVGHVVFSGKEQLVLVRPYRDALLMAMLNYKSEIRPPVEAIGELPAVSKADKKVRLAEQLIQTWSEEEFDYASYTDSYFEKVKELIEAKIEGREVVAPEAEEEAEVVNLMDALKKSMAQARRRVDSSERSNGRPQRRRRRKAS